MGYKRKRADSFPKWGKKGKRSVRKRVSKTSRGFTSNSSRSLSGQSVTFRTKRISRRRYRNHLWNSTLFKDHYRTLQSFTGTYSTPASQSVGSTALHYPLLISGNGFWLAAGGAQRIDTTIALPTNFREIIIRGGIYTMKWYNPASFPVNLDIWEIALNKVVTNLANIPNTPNIGWDPSMVPDFANDVGKVTKKTNFILQPGQSFSITRRVRVRKIDIEGWLLGFQQPAILTHGTTLGSSTAQVINFVHSYNLSFSADAA